MSAAEPVLIHGAAALVTGAAGAAARSDATDLRIADGVIVELGCGLEPRPGERVLDLCCGQAAGSSCATGSGRTTPTPSAASGS